MRVCHHSVCCPISLASTHTHKTRYNFKLKRFIWHAIHRPHSSTFRLNNHTKNSQFSNQKEKKIVRKKENPKIESVKVFSFERFYWNDNFALDLKNWIKYFILFFL